MASNWWDEFGYSENPYRTKPLPSGREGSELLVGRDDEVDDLTGQLRSSSRIPLLVGENGVGKTSIVNVAAYRMSDEFRSTNLRYLILNPLQIREPFDLHRFEQDVYHEVAQVLIGASNLLAANGVRNAEIRKLRAVLTKTSFTAGGFGLNTPFGGVSGNRSTTPNSSLERPLKLTVQGWLRRCFRGSNSGGIICLIDNLENIGTSAQVQKVLENLRDPLFNTSGLLWALCGTPAVVGGALSSGFMEGRLAKIVINNIDESKAPELVLRRLHYFGLSNANPPVDADGFKHIYAVVHSRLRSALGLCDEFAEFLHKYPRRQSPSYNRFNMLQIWLNQKAASLADKVNDIPEKSWDLFNHLAELGANIRSSKSKVVNIDNVEQLDAAAQPLVEKGLLIRSEMDKDNFMLGVTTDGWLVSYQRNNYCIVR